MQHSRVNEILEAVNQPKAATDEDFLAYPANYSFYGDFLRMSILHSAAIQLAETQGQRNQPQFFIEFLHHPALNAVAIKSPFPEDDNIYLIGINTGTVYLLERLFYTMMANPNVFPELEGELEGEHAKAVNQSYGHVEYFSSIDYPKPQSEARGMLASILTTYALLFLSLHELTHILNGHLDYKGKVFDGHLIQENLHLIPQGDISTVQRAAFLFSQTIEFDADSIGICAAASLAMAMRKGSGFVVRDELQHLMTSEHLVGLMAFASYSVFKLFGSYNSSGAPLTDNFYPPSEMRRKLLAATLVSFILNKAATGAMTRESAESISNSALNYLREAEKAFSVIDRDGADVNRPSHMHENAVLTQPELAHTEILKANFQAIRVEMQQCAFVGLYEEQ